jgi:hypothetical protein
VQAKKQKFRKGVERSLQGISDGLKDANVCSRLSIHQALLNNRYSGCISQIETARAAICLEEDRIDILEAKMEMHGEDKNQAILNLQCKIDYSAARINTYEEELAMLVRERNAGRCSNYERRS